MLRSAANFSLLSPIALITKIYANGYLTDFVIDKLPGYFWLVNAGFDLIDEAVYYCKPDKCCCIFSASFVYKCLAVPLNGTFT
jgi:hypothetical protein